MNAALTHLNAAAAAAGSSTVLPLVDPNARLNDNFNSCDLRLSKDVRLREGMKLQLLGEVFNLFNVSNILGFSTTNHSGYSARWSPDQGNPNHSRAFGKPVTTAGGIFGSGGPRAFQLAAKLTF